MTEQDRTVVPQIATPVWASLPVHVFTRGQRRLEGETYLTGGYTLRLRIETSGIDFKPLGDWAKVWQPSRMKGILVSPEHGKPFLTATQAFDINPTPRKWLAPAHIPQMEDRYVQPGWILVTRSGEVGDVTISYSPHQDKIISDDLLRVQVQDTNHLGYVYTFLRSKFGRSIVRSNKYGSVIKHLEPEHLAEIPLPVLRDSIYRELNERIAEVFRLREQAYALNLEAETQYGMALGVAPYPRFEEEGFTVRTSLIVKTRRLEGYYYNPTAQAVLEALNNSGRPLVPLRSVTERIFGVPRFKHVYTHAGIPYLDSEDLFKINPQLSKFIPKVTKRDAERYFVQRMWLLMACSGQLYGLNGSVILADTWHENKIVSNHVIRIVPSNDIRSGYLQVALGHPVYGRPLVLRLATGTSVPEIDPDDLGDFPVPRLASHVEHEIADKVETASRLRMQANQIEDSAVQRLEEHLRQLLGITVD